MNYRRPRLTRVLVLALPLLAAGCGSLLAPRPTPPSPLEVRELEARVDRDSANVPALIMLGRAHQLSGRAREAQPVLERALALEPGSPEAELLLGLAHEALGEFAEADARYRAFVRKAPDSPLIGQVNGRIEIVRRHLLLEEARTLVAREQELTPTPTPRSVAVFPFLLNTEDQSLEPLSRAIAELLVTDLGQTDRLMVLERLRVQMLLDEIELAEAGLVDPGTAARSGRLLGAEQVVQGSLRGSEEILELDAAIVGVGTGEPVGTVAERDALERLFDMEKRLALEIYRSLGIELTDAERERILRNRTESVEALLAFGLGLEADDVGNFAAASGHFQRAVSLDPSFSAAVVRQAMAEQAARAAAAVPEQLVQRVTVGDETTLFADLDAMVPGLGGRDPAAELLGSEGVGPLGGVIRVILRTSGGSND